MRSWLLVRVGVRCQHCEGSGSFCLRYLYSYRSPHALCTEFDWFSGRSTKAENGESTCSPDTAGRAQIMAPVYIWVYVAGVCMAHHFAKLYW
jgi:hypothetical protein